ncbi:hypothetical protein [Nocardioides sp. B-3]|uniref:hypothetical protein n=1 Tax=Nocardioides sp. B-3 TaxID=2895565 RepID=UPI002152B96A|nr:hypothetical protein [Nocardioides sp. B-3]UUZ58719.1 hypothetical protein LP418_21795 [Nocardioides sp. B-3]
MSCTSPSKRLVAAALVTGLALTTTACSGDEAPDADASAYDSADVMAEMTDAVADAGSVRLTLGTKQSPKDLIVDTARGNEPTFRALTMGDPSTQLDVRRVDGRVYLGGELVGHQWTYIDLDDPRLTDPESDFDAGMVETLMDIDVPGDPAALGGAVTAVKDEGAEEMAGVDARHYTLTVETTEWLEELGDASMYAAMDLPASVTMDLYVDDDSRPVRLAYEVPGEPRQSAEIGFSEWGTPVEVAVPQRAKPVS